MRRFSFRLTLVLSVASALALLAWVYGFRALLPPLPPVFYSSQSQLYRGIVGCASFFQLCADESAPLLDELNTHPGLQWSPDGRFVAIYLLEGWKMYPVECLLLREDCAPAQLDPAIVDIRVAWGPDGSLLAYMVGDAELRFRSRGCWDGSPAALCLTETITLATDATVLRHPYWSADGSRMALIGVRPPGLFLLDTACLDAPETCSARLESLPLTRVIPVWPLLSPADDAILFVALDNNGMEQLILLDPGTGAERQLTTGRQGSFQPDWSNDGRYVAYVGFAVNSPGDASIWVVDLQRNLQAAAVHHPGQDLFYPAWGPNEYNAR